jgi:RNA polymerase sigma-70 factor (ECF subfamily)
MMAKETPMRTERERDELLVERSQGGDRQAFDLLVSRYRRRLIRMLSLLVHDSVEAEDIAQETFIKALRAIRGFRHEAAFSTWLYQIGLNTGKDFLIAQSRHIPASTKIALDRREMPDAADRLCEPSTPESLLATKQIASRVDAVIAGLPLAFQTAIYLHEIEGLSYDEIAEILGCATATVRSRVFRAREIIAEKLGPLLDLQSGNGWAKH